jgi:hypothetical protein
MRLVCLVTHLMFGTINFYYLREIFALADAFSLLQSQNRLQYLSNWNHLLICFLYLVLIPLDFRMIFSKQKSNSISYGRFVNELYQLILPLSMICALAFLCIFHIDPRLLNFDTQDPRFNVKLQYWIHVGNLLGILVEQILYEHKKVESRKFFKFGSFALVYTINAQFFYLTQDKVIYRYNRYILWVIPFFTLILQLSSIFSDKIIDYSCPEVVNSESIRTQKKPTRSSSKFDRAIENVSEFF